MKRSWQTFRLMHISLQVSELPDRLLSIIRDPNGERFISKVKYQPSAKKMVKPKQVITFVFLFFVYNSAIAVAKLHLFPDSTKQIAKKSAK